MKRKVLVYGSINIDTVYNVSHIVKEGETISSRSVRRTMGGKGANQAVALKRAGCDVYMAGKTGRSALFIIRALEEEKINTDHITLTEGESGTAIIQVDGNGRNAIVLESGENRRIEKKEIDKTLSILEKGDWIVLQNEINNIPYIMEEAKRRGIKICFNASPCDENIKSYPLSLVSLLVVNETEGAFLSFSGSEEHVIKELKKNYPGTAILLTLGEKGSIYSDSEVTVKEGIYKAETVDTTAAGDTFLGFFLSSRIKGLEIKECLDKAAAAAAIAVSREGSASSVPYWEETEE